MWSKLGVVTCLELSIFHEQIVELINILGSQKISTYKIEDFLFLYLVCKTLIKRSKKLGNIFILEKLETVE